MILMMMTVMMTMLMMMMMPAASLTRSHSGTSLDMYTCTIVQLNTCTLVHSGRVLEQADPGRGEAHAARGVEGEFRPGDDDDDDIDDNVMMM